MTEKTPTPFDHDPSLLDDLDLVEWTPHAFRSEKWLAATKRLDAAGVHYEPGARYYASRAAADAPTPAPEPAPEPAPAAKQGRAKGRPGDALFGLAFAVALIGVVGAFIGANSTDAYGNHTGSPLAVIPFLVVAVVLCAFGFGRRALAALENKEPRG